MPEQWKRAPNLWLTYASTFPFSILGLEIRELGSYRFCSIDASNYLFKLLPKCRHFRGLGKNLCVKIVNNDVMV